MDLFVAWLSMGLRILFSVELRMVQYWHGKRLHQNPLLPQLWLLSRATSKLCSVYSSAEIICYIRHLRMEQLRVWDRATWDCRHVLKDHTASVTSLLCWETYLITASLDHSVKMWETDKDAGILTLKVVRQVEDESGVLALGGMYDKGGNPTLFCSRTDNTVRLLDLPTFTERGRIFTKAPVQTISVERSSRLFFTGDATGQLDVWRLD